MSGVKGKSGRRIAAPATLDKLISHARTVSLRAIKDESIPLLDRGRLATQFPLKEMAERSERVVINLSLSDELMRRIMQRLQVNDAPSLPPPDIYVTPEPNELEPNEPNDASTTITPSPDQPPQS